LHVSTLAPRTSTNIRKRERIRCCFLLILCPRKHLGRKAKHAGDRPATAVLEPKRCTGAVQASSFMSKVETGIWT